LAFIHLDNLLHFAKIDRDGRLDGYISAYLPDKVILLLLRRGDVISAVSFTEMDGPWFPLPARCGTCGRKPSGATWPTATRRLEQLAWMYASCAAPARRRLVDDREPEKLFPVLFHELFHGVLS